MTRSLVPASLALALAFTAAGAAFAEPLAVSRDDSLVTAKVAYSQSDLHSAKAAKALAFRIQLAASEVCGGDNYLVRFGAKFRTCRATALDRALAVLDAPMVAEAAGRTPSLTQAAAH